MTVLVQNDSKLSNLDFFIGKYNIDCLNLYLSNIYLQEWFKNLKSSYRPL